MASGKFVTSHPINPHHPFSDIYADAICDAIAIRRQTNDALERR